MSGPSSKEHHVRVLIVDDDEAMRDSLHALMTAASFVAETRVSSEDVRQRGIPEGTECILLDIRLGEDDDGIDLMNELRRNGVWLPVVFITGHADVPLAVRAMRAGARDFVEKPFVVDQLLGSIRAAIAAAAPNTAALAQLNRLTSREQEVFHFLAQGMTNKAVARKLLLSVRTVESYRAAIMLKLNAGSLADLVKISLKSKGSD